MRLKSTLLALALAALPLAARAQTAAPVAESVLTVEGDGVNSRSPERARVSLDIVTTDDVAARSGAKNTVTYNAFVARVATLGVTGSDVRTTSYNVAFVPHPPRDIPADQRQARYGYITTRNLSVLVTPLENVGKVVDAATASGVTEIGGVGFELKDRHAAYVTALAAAMVDAKATATAVASAGGFHIGRVRSVDVNAETPGGPLPLALRRGSPAASAEAPTEIAPNGPIDVAAHVRVTYEIR